MARYVRATVRANALPVKVHCPTVVGVDVGGTQKGFYAVALREAHVVGKLMTCSAAGVVTWCRNHEASVVAIDAPCKWSVSGRSRACERQLAGLGMSAFSTPTLAIGQVNSFYRWMLNGAELFQLLAPQYSLFEGGTVARGRLRFETYPHAIACALAGRTLSAKQKRLDRRRLLNVAGISTDTLTTIDAVDAALCALTAQHVLAGTFKAFGDEAEGYIVVPSIQGAGSLSPIVIST